MTSLSGRVSFANAPAQGHRLTGTLPRASWIKSFRSPIQAADFEVKRCLSGYLAHGLNFNLVETSSKDHPVVLMPDRGELQPMRKPQELIFRTPQGKEEIFYKDGIHEVFIPSQLFPDSMRLVGRRLSDLECEVPLGLTIFIDNLRELIDRPLPVNWVLSMLGYSEHHKHLRMVYFGNVFTINDLPFAVEKTWILKQRLLGEFYLSGQVPVVNFISESKKSDTRAFIDNIPQVTIGDQAYFYLPQEPSAPGDPRGIRLGLPKDFLSPHVASYLHQGQITLSLPNKPEDVGRIQAEEVWIRAGRSILNPEQLGLAIYFIDQTRY